MNRWTLALAAGIGVIAFGVLTINPFVAVIGIGAAWFARDEIRGDG